MPCEPCAEHGRDLEQFAWTVSHDLRTPLRAVSNYLDLFREENDPKLDGRARDLLDRARGGCGRMAERIEALMKLANLGHGELRRAPVDLSALATAVVSELRGLHPGRSVEVQIEPGIVALADPALAAVVLENLIGNAWKFAGKTPAPLIRVGSVGGWYYVRDNGAGFDARAAAGLFLPFQRFHSREDYDGTGIGLAMVKRIILRHGGEIRAEAEPGKGAAFFFTLGPAPEP